MKKLLLAFSVAMGLWAAPTRIVDTVKYANGANASGTARIEWPSFTVGSTPVAAGFTQVTITDGVLDVSLQPTDSATPSGTVYTVRLYLQNAPVSVEYWTVPTSASAVTLPDVRMAPLTALSGFHAVDTYNDWTMIATPGTNPASGHLRTYAKTGSGICWLDTAGTETCAGAANVSSVFGRNGAVTAQSGDYTASQVTNTPAGGIAATTVQAALNELDTEKAAASHWHVIGDTTGLQAALDGKLAAASNLSDLTSASAARSSLGLGGAAVMNVGTTAGTVAAGDHSHAPYPSAFTSQTSVTVSGTSHGIGRADLTVTCYDANSPRNLIEPDTVTVDPSTYDVTVTFAVAQSGRLVLR